MAAYYWSLILLPVYFGCVLPLNQQEINALKELKTRWNVTDWQGEPNCTTWSRHLTCNGHLNVISLDFGFAKPELLQNYGSIPEEICNLTYLEELKLYGNRLSGEIPNCIGDLDLNVFDVRHNNLSGALPESFRDAPLRYLLLSNNPLLRGHGNKLPDYITPNFATKSIVDDVRSFDCPGFLLLYRAFQVTAPLIQLDPQYYNYSLCDCKSGYFGSPPDKCRQCLLHGSCYGDSIMNLKKGFYPVTDNTGEVQGFIECKEPNYTRLSTCNPGGNCFYGKKGLSGYLGNCSLCAPNYYGRLCSKCTCSSQACYYHDHNECKPCKKIKAITVVLYSIALIVTLSLFAIFHNSSLVRLLMIIVLVSLALTLESGSWLYLNILVVIIILIPATSNGLSSGLVKSLIFFVQTSSVLMPPYINHLLSSILSRFSFSNVKFIGLVCLFPQILGISGNASLHRYIFSLCAPIIVFLLVLVFLVFKNVLLFVSRKAGFHSPSSAKIRSQILFSLVFIAYFSFFNASTLVIFVFICSKDASGYSYMTAQHYRSVKCHSSEWHNMVIAAIIGAIFLVFLPLIIFTVVLQKYKSTLDDPELMSWLGYLYVSYRPRDSTRASKLRNRSWFYFEIVYMIFRFLLAVSVSVQGNASPLGPSVTAMLLLAFAAILLRLKPYVRMVDNNAASISIMTLIIELFGSVLVYNGDANAQIDYTWFIMIIYAGLNGLTLFMYFVLILWYGRDDLIRNVHNLCNRLRECRRPNSEDQEPCHESVQQ